MFFKILLLVSCLQGQNFYASETEEYGFKREIGDVKTVLLKRMESLRAVIPTFLPRLTDNIITILGSAREIPRGSRWQSESFEPLANNFF